MRPNLNEEFKIRTWNMYVEPNHKDWYEYIIRKALIFIFPVELNTNHSTACIRYRKDDWVNSDSIPKSYDDSQFFKRGLLQFLEIFPTSKERSVFYNFKRAVVNKLNFSITNYIDSYLVYLRGNNTEYTNKYIASHKTNSLLKSVKHTYLDGLSSSFVFKDKFSVFESFDFTYLCYGSDEIAKIRSGWQRSDGFTEALNVAIYDHFKQYYPNRIIGDNISHYTKEVLSKYTIKELDTILCKFLVELLNN